MTGKQMRSLWKLIRCARSAFLCGTSKQALLRIGTRRLVPPLSTTGLITTPSLALRLLFFFGAAAALYASNRLTDPVLHNRFHPDVHVQIGGDADDLPSQTLSPSGGQATTQERSETHSPFTPDEMPNHPLPLPLPLLIPPTAPGTTEAALAVTHEPSHKPESVAVEAARDLQSGQASQMAHSAQVTQSAQGTLSAQQGQVMQTLPHSESSRQVASALFAIAPADILRPFEITQSNSTFRGILRRSSNAGLDWYFSSLALVLAPADAVRNHGAHFEAALRQVAIPGPMPLNPAEGLRRISASGQLWELQASLPWGLFWNCAFDEFPAGAPLDWQHLDDCGRIWRNWGRVEMDAHWSLLDTTDDLQTVRPPDSHDAQAAVFLLALARWLELTQSWDWLNQTLWRIPLAASLKASPLEPVSVVSSGPSFGSGSPSASTARPSVRSPHVTELTRLGIVKGMIQHNLLNHMQDGLFSTFRHNRHPLGGVWDVQYRMDNIECLAALRALIPIFNRMGQTEFADTLRQYEARLSSALDHMTSSRGNAPAAYRKWARQGDWPSMGAVNPESGSAGALRSSLPLEHSAPESVSGPSAIEMPETELSAHALRPFSPIVHAQTDAINMPSEQASAPATDAVAALSQSALAHSERLSPGAVAESKVDRGAFLQFYPHIASQYWEGVFTETAGRAVVTRWLQLEPHLGPYSDWWRQSQLHLAAGLPPYLARIMHTPGGQGDVSPALLRYVSELKPDNSVISDYVSAWRIARVLSPGP